MNCPICEKESKWKGNPWRPFCSERCKMVDLGKWAGEEYSVPGEKSPASGENAQDEFEDQDWE